MVFTIFIKGSSTSCIKSLSREEITIGNPLLAPITARVAITSSASTSGISTTGIPMALQIDFNGASCSRNSGGIGGLFAL